MIECIYSYNWKPQLPQGMYVTVVYGILCNQGDRSLLMELHQLMKFKLRGYIQNLVENST